MKNSGLKIATWNINGIRSGQEKLKEYLASYKPDVLCLQEVKLDPLKRGQITIGDYHQHYYHADKNGYSGTAVFSKNELIVIDEGMGIEEFDSEARLLNIKYQDFNIINLYFPHSRRDLSRLQYKMNFNYQVKEYLKLFPKEKVIVCGDFNVAHNEIDIANPKSNIYNAGFTQIERDFMTELLSDDWKDVYREKYPDRQEFTWWSNMRNCRGRNVGWRIDYFLISSKMLERVSSCEILTQVYGSDHCPVQIEIK